MAILPNNTIRADDFINESEIPTPQSGAVGKVAKLEADGKIAKFFVHWDEIITILRKSILGNTILATNSSTQSTTATAFTKIKETRMDETMNVARVTVEAAGTIFQGVDYSYSEILFYRNGSPVGTARSVANGIGTNYQTYTQDFPSGLGNGDLIQVFGRRSGSGAPTVFARNLQIRADATITHVRGEQLITPVPIVDSQPSLATTNLL
jgi:hypothetical protein